MKDHDQPKLTSVCVECLEPADFHMVCIKHRHLYYDSPPVGDVCPCDDCKAAGVQDDG